MTVYPISSCPCGTRRIIRFVHWHGDGRGLYIVSIVPPQIENRIEKLFSELGKDDFERFKG